jgi:transcriptional regulator with XRE-family HTH domain
VTDRNELKHFESKKYRDGYLQSRVRGYIAYQIQALREKLDMTQEAFANLTGKKQSAISRLEDTEYGRVSVQTLLDVASATNVALVVKFVSYPEFLDQTRLMAPEALQPDTIQESIKKTTASSNEFRGAAYQHFLEAQNSQQRGGTASAIANDNINRISPRREDHKIRSAATEIYARALALPLPTQAGAA